jgi:chemotaxis protein methyltransferase CheR
MTHKIDTGSNKMKLSEKTFDLFREFIQKEIGIRMPDAKRILLESRLQKRLRATGRTSFESYHAYVFSEEGMAKELVKMMDVITTNKTDFFRESKHFDFLVEKALPAVLGKKNGVAEKHIACWSAGCSSGEEPYTLAMVLSEYIRNCKGIEFSIMATDISTRVLGNAMLGIYSEKDIVPVPMELRRRYLMRSKDRSRGAIRIIPELRSKIVFRRLNFMQNDYNLSEPVDIIFCRNVLIYFDHKTQEQVVNNLCRYLKPGGFLFTGHSETLHSLNVPLVQAGSSVYIRK